MLSLSRLLEIDARCSFSEAIPECLGDRYLCVKNLLYRTIRLIALEDGIKYSRNTTPLWHDYQIASLLFLDAILRSKEIPYSDTTTTLQRVIGDINPSFAVNGKLLLQILKRNYLLHESCHCVADKRIPVILSGEVELSLGQQKVIRALLGESFAATVERMAWTMVDSPTHALFFNLNSYIEHSPEHLERVTEVLREVEMSVLFRLSLIVFFWNNLAKRPLSEEEVGDVLDHFYGADDTVRRQKEKLVALYTKALTISERFLKETTPAYFRLVGLEREFEELTEGKLTAERVGRLFDSTILDDLTSVALRPQLHAVALSA